MISTGTSGWVYQDWKGVLYPDGLPQRRWLEHYADNFGTVEINASFYHLPRRATLAMSGGYAVRNARALREMVGISPVGQTSQSAWTC